MSVLQGETDGRIVHFFFESELTHAIRSSRQVTYPPRFA